MRIRVVLDDELIAHAQKCGGYRTKRSAIEAGLRLLVQMKSQQSLRALRGKVKWKGDLEKMRRD